MAEKKISFEQALSRLEEIVDKLENGNQLGEYQKRYLSLVSAYAYLFKNNPDFEKAK